MQDQRNYDKSRTTERDDRFGRTDEKAGQDKPAGNEKSEDETKIYLTSDSTLQSPEEAAEDHNSGVKEEEISVSRDDLHETNADKRGGQRPGRHCRKKKQCGGLGRY